MTGVELSLQGVLNSGSVLPWIVHRARLLSLSGSVTRTAENEICIVLFGPSTLIDAMETACMLGPGDVLVENLHRREVWLASAPEGFEVA